MLVGNILLKDLTVIKMNDLKYLLIYLSVTCKNQKEYLLYVNTLAKLLMGDKFGYDAGSDHADVYDFKADAKQIFKDVKTSTTLKPLKAEKQTLKVLQGGKKVDQ